MTGLPSRQRAEGTGAAAGLLDEVHLALTDYVAFPSDHAAVAVVLWVAVTHAISVIEHATRLVIKSPEKRCGKSRLMELLAALAHNPLVTANISAAAMFRSIGADPPTLFMDEADAKFGTRLRAEQNEELRAVLNAGFRRGAPTIRLVGSAFTPTQFPTFAMACLAGIGDLPDTIEDRAVVVNLRRRAPGETVKDFRIRRDEPRLAQLQGRLDAWVATVLPQLSSAEPVSDLTDRAADTWDGLLAVADAAGGHWPGKARAAAYALVRQHESDSAGRTVGLRLLGDIGQILNALPNGTAFISSADLTTALHRLPDSQWAQERMTSRRLAAAVKGYGVHPGHDTTKASRLQGRDAGGHDRPLRPTGSPRHGRRAVARQGGEHSGVG